MALSPRIGVLAAKEYLMNTEDFMSKNNIVCPNSILDVPFCVLEYLALYDHNKVQNVFFS